jgi:choline dehydrogenase-like flavoprotein
LIVGSYDVIVIGSGAGGGTLVHRLAPSGKRILLLERGDWLPREPENWLAQDVFVDGRYMSAETWYDAEDKPFQPQVHYFVGGATKLYGAALTAMANGLRVGDHLLERLAVRPVAQEAAGAV